MSKVLLNICVCIMLQVLFIDQTQSFTFKLSGEENMRCYRFRNPKDKKALKVVEFFYESKMKNKDLQVQVHDELFKMAEDGQSKVIIYIRIL